MSITLTLTLTLYFLILLITNHSCASGNVIYIYIHDVCVLAGARAAKRLPGTHQVSLKRNVSFDHKTGPEAVFSYKLRYIVGF